MLGEVVGNYLITEVIGSGGMGVVYRAEHVLLGKQAAVKVLLPERTANTDLVERFFNEARASTLVQHPGIVEIFDYGHLENDSAYIVMELLEGETLGERLQRRNQLPPGEVVSIANHIASVLYAAHEHGIIHRDLKPDNVFLVADPAVPNGERAKVLDFGIAKLSADLTTDGVKTQTGTLMGTPYYMSPEQCRGAGEIDHRSDIYSLGCVMFQMLCGLPPFVMQGPGDVLAAHIHLPPPRPRSMAGAVVPPQLELVLLQMLAKNPADRFASMQEVIVALNQTTPAVYGPPVPGADYTAPNSGPALAYNLRTHSTTLGSTSGEYTTLDRERRRWHHWAIQAAVAGLVVTGAWFGLRATGQSGAPTAPPALAATAPNDPVAAAAKPTLPAPDRPKIASLPMRANTATAQSGGAGVAAATVVLSIHSQPSGAKVYREADGVYVGRTPLDVTVRRGRGRADFILRRRGYHHERVSIPVAHNEKQTVTLRRRSSHARAAAKETAAAKKAAPAAKKAAAKKKAAAAKQAAANKAAPKTTSHGPGVTPVTAPAASKPPSAKPAKPGKNDAIDPFSRHLIDPSAGGKASGAN